MTSFNNLITAGFVRTRLFQALYFTLPLRGSSAPVFGASPIHSEHRLCLEPRKSLIDSTFLDILRAKPGLIRPTIYKT